MADCDVVVNIRSNTFRRRGGAERAETDEVQRVELESGLTNSVQLPAWLGSRQRKSPSSCCARCPVTEAVLSCELVRLESQQMPIEIFPREEGDGE